VGRLPALFHGFQTMQKPKEPLTAYALEPQRKSLEQEQPSSLLRRHRPLTVAAAVAPAPGNQSHGQSPSLLRRLGETGAPPAAARRNPNESRWSMNIIHRPTKVVGAMY